MPDLKQIKVSQVLTDLKSGVTRWKKEDLGFGSLEEKYELTFTEVQELISHPKIKGVKTKIPTLLIVDDTEETPEEITDETTEEGRPEVQTSKPSVIQATIEVGSPVSLKKNEKPKKIEAFI